MEEVTSSKTFTNLTGQHSFIFKERELSTATNVGTLNLTNKKLFAEKHTLL
jgi:hypothetical protein